MTQVPSHQNDTDEAHSDDRPVHPFAVGDEVRWEWTGPGGSYGWFKARLVERAPADYPEGWASEITEQGTLYCPENWNCPIGYRVYVDEISLTVVTAAEVSE